MLRRIFQAGETRSFLCAAAGDAHASRPRSCLGLRDLSHNITRGRELHSSKTYRQWVDSTADRYEKDAGVGPPPQQTTSQDESTDSLTVHHHEQTQSHQYQGTEPDLKNSSSSSSSTSSNETSPSAESHTLPFGKHKGKRISELPRSYLLTYLLPRRHRLQTTHPSTFEAIMHHLQSDPDLARGLGTRESRRLYHGWFAVHRNPYMRDVPEPISDYRLTFGKWVGKKLDEVPEAYVKHLVQRTGGGERDAHGCEVVKLAVKELLERRPEFRRWIPKDGK